MSGGKGRGEGLEKSFALISRLGFDGVEIAVRDPAIVDASRILDLAQGYGLEIAAIGTGQAFVDEGICFTHPRASVRKKAVKRIKDQLLLGKNLKAPVIIFHMNIEDSDISRSLKGAAPYLAHVHLADSNRHAPGQGHIDFKPVFSTLKRIGYKGYISMEIMPKPDPETAVILSAEFLEKHGFIKVQKRGE